MYSSPQLALKYLRYWLSASNGKGHGVHSPFVFDFIQQVLSDTRQFDCFNKIEALRNELKGDHTEIDVPDPGAGSRTQPDQKRKISAIANSSLKPKKYSQLLFRIIHHYKPGTVLELGTSLGITTAYFSCANPGAKIITMEGVPAVAAIAKNNFKTLGCANVEVMEGNFNDILPSITGKLPTIDFAFIDGNHRKDPTLNYFSQLMSASTPATIFVFDDIHWSAEMEQAWLQIKQHPSVRLSIDLFFLGIVFFRNEQKTKTDFAIRF